MLPQIVFPSQVHERCPPVHPGADTCNRGLLLLSSANLQSTISVLPIKRNTTKERYFFALDVDQLLHFMGVGFGRHFRVFMYQPSLETSHSPVLRLVGCGFSHSPLYLKDEKMGGQNA